MQYFFEKTAIHLKCIAVKYHLYLAYETRSLQDITMPLNRFDKDSIHSTGRLIV